MEALRQKTTFSSVKVIRRHGNFNDDDAFNDSTLGSLHVTTHHLIFDRSSREPPGGLGEKGEEEQKRGESGDQLLIPLSLLHSVTRNPPCFTGQPNAMLIRTRDFITYSIQVLTQEEVDRLFETIKQVCERIQLGGLQNRWAFSISSDDKARRETTRRGWEIYDPKKEFERMGIGKKTKTWRFTNLNSDFKFCPSYPAQIVVPSKISDTTLNYAVKYRSKSRIPGLVYLHWANEGSITRSSQPMVGITQTSRSIQDEKLIEAIFTSHSQHSTTTTTSSSKDHIVEEGGGIVYGAMATNVIIDARPTKNAYANSVKGAGTENMTFYKNCRKEYLGIDNIHVMRSSLNQVFQALTEAESSGHLDRTALRRSNWLSHLTNILEGTLIVIRTIHLSNSHVLVHCSDGWDRTSQLSSLPQICLDPFYRTGKGLAVLIEKDWLSYGHKFTDRSGLLCKDRIEFFTNNSSSSSKTGGQDHHQQQQQSSSSTTTSFFNSVQKQFNSHTSTSFSSSQLSKEVCPVFQQFLDCIYQIQKQFPKRFEWNEKLLRKLVWETYSGKTGTFLFNSEMERFELKARERTSSVWDEIFDLVNGEEGNLKLKPEFLNPDYDATLDDPNAKSPTSDQGVLLFDPQNVRYWFELFGRSDQEMNPPPPPPPSQPDPSLVATVAEHQVVTSSEDDPVFNNNFLSPSKLISSLSLNASSSSSSSSSSSTTITTSPTPNLHASHGAGGGGAGREQQGNLFQPPPTQQLAETVQKFGWSAWKSVQKLGQEAAKQYKERTTEGENTSDRGNSSSNDSSNGQSSVGTNSSSSGGGMWSRFSTLSTNPWQQQTQQEETIPSSSNSSSPSPSPSHSYSDHSSSSIPYTPYQPRKTTTTTTTTTTSQHTPMSPPNPVIRQPSSALSINPWETISKEDALPISPSRDLNSQKPVEDKALETTTTGGSGGDPLGVGGF